jgi:hypothetical protein
MKRLKKFNENFTSEAYGIDGSRYTLADMKKEGASGWGAIKKIRQKNSGRKTYTMDDFMNMLPEEHKIKFEGLLPKLNEYKGEGDVSKLIYDFGKKNDTIDSTLDELNRYLSGDFDDSDGDFSKSVRRRWSNYKG